MERAPVPQIMEPEQGMEQTPEPTEDSNGASPRLQVVLDLDETLIHTIFEGV